MNYFGWELWTYSFRDLIDKLLSVQCLETKYEFQSVEIVKKSYTGIYIISITTL